MCPVSSDHRDLPVLQSGSPALVEVARLGYHPKHMNLFRGLALSLLQRRLVKIFTSIDQRLAEQNSYLKRLADQVAPQIAESEPKSAEAGVDFLNPIEAAVAQSFIDRTYKDTGHLPTDDEIARFLDTEAAVDLQARLDATA
jgi:hypothetical protein